MKKLDTRQLIFGISVFALAFGALSSVPAKATSANETRPGETVSVVGTPNPPPASDMPVPPPAATPDYPPQPVSVSPAEDMPAPSTAAAPSPMPVPVPSSRPVTAQAPSPPPPPGSPIPGAAPAPSQNGLTPGLTPVPKAADGSISGTNVMGDSGATQKHSGTYYDATAIVPDSELAKAGATGPRKVDPALEPGQKFVVVEKAGTASSYEAQYVAATRALKLGRYAASMEMFEKLYKKNHRDPRILMGLAVSQQGAGFRESAAKTYEDLLVVEPNNADAIINLMGIMKAQYPSVTLNRLMTLRNKYPTNPGVPAQIALINAEQGNYDDAMRYFEIASSIDPRNASHVYNMAIITDKKGNASKAIQLYEQALQMDASYGDTASSLPREQIYDRLVVLRRKV